MNNILSGLTSDTSIQEPTDSLGMRGPLESGIYDMAIEMAYADITKKGSRSVSFTFIDSAGKRLKVTEYVTGGDAKGNKNYYEKDGKKSYLPGFTTVNNICLLTAGKELGQLNAEKKVIKLWDFKSRKEIPQEKMVLTELLGLQITLGVLKQIEDKNELQNDGNYAPSGEQKTINVLGKSFKANDGRTVTEIKAGVTEAVFINDWRKEFTGKTIDKSKGVAASPAGAPLGLAAAGSTPAATPPTTSLFGS